VLQLAVVEEDAAAPLALLDPQALPLDGEEPTLALGAHHRSSILPHRARGNAPEMP
jgi:hypothetical protein